MRLTANGIVLRETDYKEADKILTVLTREFGKVTVQSRACRRKNSRLAAGSQLLVYSEMTLQERNGRLSLSEADPREQFRRVREDISLLSLGSYFAEVTEHTVPEGTDSGELLSLLLNSLYALDTLGRPPEMVKAVFELRLLCAEGYEPILDSCAVCGREPEKALFHLRQGVLCCRDCRKECGPGICLPVAPSVLAAARHIAGCGPKKLFSFAMDAAGLARLGELTEAYLLTRYERGFRTLDYYKKLCMPAPFPGARKGDAP